MRAHLPDHVHQVRRPGGDGVPSPGAGRPSCTHQGRTEARLYGANELDGVGGTGSVFLLLDEPEVYGLPPDPRVPTADLPRMYKLAGLAAGGMVAAAVLSFLGGRS